MKSTQEKHDSIIRKLKSKKEIEDFIYSEEYYQTYQNYERIISYVKGFKQRYPSMVDEFVLTKTLENREVLGFKIHSPGNNTNKKTFWLNSLLHAREWVGPPTTQYSIWQLLEQYKQGNQRVKNILDNVNVIYIPIVNVDGFIYSHTNNRMWRKNRRGGYGVDLNRNWKAGWGIGSSTSRTSEVYRGEAPNSENENKAIHDYFIANPNIKAGIDFHSYSQVILRPWGKSTQPTPHETDLFNFGEKMATEIKKSNNTVYGNIRAYRLGVANGMDDEMYETHKFNSSYCIELRPTGAGGGGFALPARFILPTAKENYLGVLEILERVKNFN